MKEEKPKKQRQFWLIPGDLKERGAFSHINTETALQNMKAGKGKISRSFAKELGLIRKDE